MSKQKADRLPPSGPDRVTIRKLPTGVSGLDEILGGGLSEYSFNIIAGAPGCGKTTLAHQILLRGFPPRVSPDLGRRIRPTSRCSMVFRKRKRKRRA